MEKRMTFRADMFLELVRAQGGWNPAFLEIVKQAELVAFAEEINLNRALPKSPTGTVARGQI